MEKDERIEKEIVLKAPRARVWRALTDAAEFGAWFGCKLQGNFAVGNVVRGKITYPGYEHLTMELTIDRLEPEEHFAFRWHPYAVDPKVDYSAETPTLVVFRLSETDGGTRLAVVETGFGGLPEWRRAEAFRMNSQGWQDQLENVRRHVEK